MSLVLVADDEPGVLEVLCEVVEELGHQVMRARDGREALKLALAQPPQLVVTDHMMPRMSGLDLCRSLGREQHLKDVPVIVLSAGLPNGAPEARAFLAKPFELSEFERVVVEVLSEIKAAPRDPAVGGAHPPEDESHEALISWAAHEIKTPLAVARINLQLLDRSLGAGGSASDKTHLRSVAKQLKTMELLVNSMVDASRLADGQLTVCPEPADFRAFLDERISRWRQLQPTIQFELELAEGTLPLSFDLERTKQIIDHLLDNAVRYATPPLRLRISLEASPGQVTLRIIDFGPGLSLLEQERLFARRVRSADGVRGHGLGLYIASELALLQGGALSVCSAQGCGSTFALTLPRTV